MQMTKNEQYPLFEKWSGILDWTLDRVEKYPKSSRFTLANRLANLSIDVLEGIIECIYTQERTQILRKLNLYMEKLRVLFRISMQRRYISKRQYEYIIRELQESGCMIGGWTKHEANR
jgi:hypothetical protein